MMLHTRDFQAATVGRGLQIVSDSQPPTSNDAAGFGPRRPNNEVGLRYETWDDLKFPSKLHIMLGQALDEGFEDVVSWTPCGKAFRIHKKKTFIDTVMPAYFPGISKFKSFQRQLNLYGIHKGKMYHGGSSWNTCTRLFDEYSHPYLIRDVPGLTMKMTRPPSSRGKVTSTSPRPEQELQSLPLSTSVATSKRLLSANQQIEKQQQEIEASRSCEKGQRRYDGDCLYDLLEPIPALPLQGLFNSINPDDEKLSLFKIQDDIQDEIITTFLL